MAMVGYNPDLVRGSLSRVKNAYEEFVNAAISRMGESFIEELSKGWACQEALEFVAMFKESVDSLTENARRVFSQIVDNMTSSARSWAIATGGLGAVVVPSVSIYLSRNLDISSMKENLNGVRGADDKIVGGALNSLASVVSRACRALDSAQDAVKNCGFIGAYQEGALIAALTSVKANFIDMINQLSSGAKTSIDASMRKYGLLGAAVASGFGAAVGGAVAGGAIAQGIVGSAMNGLNNNSTGSSFFPGN